MCGRCRAFRTWHYPAFAACGTVLGWRNRPSRRAGASSDMVGLVFCGTVRLATKNVQSGIFGGEMRVRDALMPRHVEDQKATATFGFIIKSERTMT